MRALKNDDRGAEIIRRLKRGESHRNIVEWLGRPMTRITQNLTPASDLKLGQAIEDYRRRLIDDHDPCYWISVTSDGNLINHLISLYMTWIHPAHMLIDETTFLLSFHDCLDTHCSDSLVNAICALSCQLLHNGWDDDEETKDGIDSLGLQFMDEVRSLTKTADPYSMTTSQTYAVMFLVELGLGKGQAATSHLRLAVEILAVRQPMFDSDEAASWGILSLHSYVVRAPRQSVELISIAHGRRLLTRNLPRPVRRLSPSFETFHLTSQRRLGAFTDNPATWGRPSVRVMPWSPRSSTPNCSVSSIRPLLPFAAGTVQSRPVISHSCMIDTSDGWWSYPRRYGR